MEGYIAGLVDADGCVELQTQKKDGYRSSVKITPWVDIRLREYFAGLMDGDGCITQHVNKTKSCRKYNSYPYIIYEMCQSKRLEELFKKFCYGLKIVPYVGRRNNLICLSVYGVEKVKIFLSSIEPYLIIKKPQATIMLNKIIPLMEKKEHLSKNGFLKLMDYSDELSSYQSHNVYKKYTRSFFEELWKNKEDAWFSNLKVIPEEMYMMAFKLRGEKYTYRKISAILTEKFNIPVSGSNVYLWVSNKTKPINMKNYYHEKVQGVIM